MKNNINWYLVIVGFILGGISLSLFLVISTTYIYSDLVVNKTMAEIVMVICLFGVYTSSFVINSERSK